MGDDNMDRTETIGSASGAVATVLASTDRERRTAPRARMLVQVRATLPDGRVVLTEARDVSRSGMFLAMPQPPAHGTEMLLELLLPTKPPPRFNARVQRHTPQGVGVHLVGDAALVAEMLERAVEMQRVFGNYQLEALVGRGGMAEVFRAVALAGPHAGKTLAIKRIRPDLASIPGMVDRFVREGAILRRLNHPGIVHILDAGSVEDTYYIAMEYVDGCSLREVLDECARRNIFLPVDFSCYLIKCVAEALHHAHQVRTNDGRLYGLVHRDVAPSNIFVSTTGDVLLGDFGVAHVSALDANHKAGHMVAGKDAYLAPEQLAGKPLSAASDVFSLGAVFYEMLTNHAAFAAPTPEQIHRRILDGDAPAPSSFRSKIPAALDQLVAAALAVRRPEDRSLWERLRMAPGRINTAQELADRLTPLFNNAIGTQMAIAAVVTNLFRTREQPAPAPRPQAPGAPDIGNVPNAAEDTPTELPSMSAAAAAEFDRAAETLETLVGVLPVFKTVATDLGMPEALSSIENELPQAATALSRARLTPEISALLTQAESDLLEMDSALTPAAVRKLLSDAIPGQGLLFYARLLVSRLSPDRFERVVDIMARLCTGPSGAVLPFDNVKDLLIALGARSDVTLETLAAACAFFEGAVQRLATFNNLDSLFNSGFIVDVEGYRISLRGQLLEPEILYASTSLDVAFRQRAQALAKTAGITRSQLEHRLAAARLEVDQVFKISRRQATDNQRFERRRKPRVAARVANVSAGPLKDAHRSKGPLSLVQKMALATILVSLPVAVKNIIAWQDDGLKTLSVNELRALSPMLVEGGMSEAPQGPRVFIGQADSARWMTLSRSDRMAEAGRLRDALKAKGVANLLVSVDDRVAIRVQDGQFMQVE